MNDPAVFLVLFLFGGLLFILLGLPLKYEKVPRNWFYGFRTRKTLSNDEIWYAVNRLTGIDMIRTGAVVTASALILLALRNTIAPETSIVVLTVTGACLTLWMMVHGFLFLRRL